MMLAHGIGGVRDLPVPTWLFSWGAAVVLVLSFLLLGTLWTRSQLDRRAEGRPFPPGLERALRSTALHVLLGLFSAALLVLVFLTALLGEPSSATNLAPTFVYVIFWLGLVPLQVVLGNVWPALNPWLAIASAVAWIWRSLGRTWNPIVAYPERLGVYPAALLLFAFVALELCYVDPANPRALALAIALYSYATWFGMAAVGRRLWAERGEAFAVYFGLLARIAPFGERNGRLVVRTPFSGLAGAERRSGMLAVVAVMLGSVGFDGLSRSSAWQDLRARVEGPYVPDSPGVADLVGTLLALAGLLGCMAVVVLAYLAATRLARRVARAERPLEPEFLQSLVPIALVYAVAHYLTLLVVQGQFALPLASDPFGYGWDLLGAADFAPNLAPLSPNAVWYVQVGALVAGHVAGLAIAHDRAVSLFPPRSALRSQYALLALMVAYTVGGLWLLSQD
ncbi:MAG: hypothetical protein MSC30_12825 [Gaiellaceae bacterium MAG52_C11]|nr:hypothetical protein [Candidatus Gaiellasilicea maunaloa]